MTEQGKVEAESSGKRSVRSPLLLTDLLFVLVFCLYNLYVTWRIIKEISFNKLEFNSSCFGPSTGSLRLRVKLPVGFYT